MRFTTLGSDRVLHEGAGYRRKDYKLPDYPKGSRENPSEAKSEGGMQFMFLRPPNGLRMRKGRP